MQDWVREECIVFYRTSDEYGWMSNMHRGYAFEIGGRVFPTSEHLYIAYKFASKPKLIDELLSIDNPIDAKRWSYQHQRDWIPNWTAQVALDSMLQTLRWKFASHRVLREMLVYTGDKPIVEASSRDWFWGAGPPTNKVLRGENHLGKLLMKVREEQKSGVPYRRVER